MLQSSNFFSPEQAWTTSDFSYAGPSWIGYARNAAGLTDPKAAWPTVGKLRTSGGKSKTQSIALIE